MNEPLNNFMFQAIFNNIYFIIANHKKELSNNSKIYLEHADSFFNDVILSLRSLNYSNDTTRDIEYHFINNLRDIVNVSNLGDKTSFKLNPENLNTVQSYFTKLKNDLITLKNNPQEFYLNSDLKNIKKTIRNMSNIFTEDSIMSPL